jgi:hypothetical protein
MMGEEPRANTILLAGAGDFRSVVFPDGTRGGIRDASYLEFIVEDLVSHSAVKLAIDPHSVYYESTGMLPRLLRDRVVKVDPRCESVEKVAAILGPVYRELRIEFGGVGGITVPAGRDDDAGDLLTLATSLHVLIIGVDYCVQVQGNAEVSLAAAERLKQKVRSSESRAVLATIEGLYRGYSRQVSPALGFRPGLRSEYVEHFARFVEDETYRRMAQEAGLVGVPTRMTHALVRLRRLAADFVTRQEIADVVELGSRPLEAATRLPIPGPGILSRLLSKTRYLPPLISMDDAHERALAEWRRAEPPMVVPPDLRRVIGPVEAVNDEGGNDYRDVTE